MRLIFSLPLPIFVVIYSWLSRSSTARGSCTGLVIVSPPKVKASKSILFTNDPSTVKNKNAELPKLTHYLCSVHGRQP